jgi:hypothetical protein
VDGAGGAHALAERCLVELHSPFVIEGVTLSIEVSIGLALAPQGRLGRRRRAAGG